MANTIKSIMSLIQKKIQVLLRIEEQHEMEDDEEEQWLEEVRESEDNLGQEAQDEEEPTLTTLKGKMMK